MMSDPTYVCTGHDYLEEEFLGTNSQCLLLSSFKVLKGV
jgi:hypothetical protein